MTICDPHLIEKLKAYQGVINENLIINYYIENNYQKLIELLSSYLHYKVDKDFVEDIHAIIEDIQKGSCIKYVAYNVIVKLMFKLEPILCKYFNEHLINPNDNNKSFYNKKNLIDNIEMNPTSFFLLIIFDNVYLSSKKIKERDEYTVYLFRHKIMHGDCRTALFSNARCLVTMITYFDFAIRLSCRDSQFETI